LKASTASCRSRKASERGGGSAHDRVFGDHRKEAHRPVHVWTRRAEPR
jgi:hypothetical protein